LGKGKIVATIIVILILVGFGYYFYQLYTVAKNVKVEDATISNISFEGFNKIFITFKVVVNNPSNYGVTLEKITYEIYFDGQYLGEGIKKDIYIPSNSKKPIYFSLETTGTNVVNLIKNLLKQKIINYKVSGIISLPIKPYGTIKILTIDIPYTIKGTYTRK